jgi:hypothetical protein
LIPRNSRKRRFLQVSDLYQGFANPFRFATEQEAKLVKAKIDGDAQ